jgi:hypothetical protein
MTVLGLTAAQFALYMRKLHQPQLEGEPAVKYSAGTRAGEEAGKAEAVSRAPVAQMVGQPEGGLNSTVVTVVAPVGAAVPVLLQGHE